MNPKNLSTLAACLALTLAGAAPSVAAPQRGRGVRRPVRAAAPAALRSAPQRQLVQALSRGVDLTRSKRGLKGLVRGGFWGLRYPQLSRWARKHPGAARWATNYPRLAKQAVSRRPVRRGGV